MKHIMNLSLVLLLALSSCSSNGEKSGNSNRSSNENEVTVYTFRHHDADKELFAQFEEETGIKVNVVKSKEEELVMKIESEGKSSLADVLFTADAGSLSRAKDKGVLQSINSEELNSNIPVKFRDPDGFWYGITKRARVIIYNPEVINESELSTYEDLANPKWKNSLAITSSSNMNNQSLMAFMIAQSSAEEASDWAQNVRANMYAEPKGNDRDQIKAVYSGDAKLAMANSYCLGLMRKSDDPQEKKIGKAMKVIFPNSLTTGTHINISGAGICKHSPNKENAIKFLEFLASKKAQEKFSAANSEYPVNANASKSLNLMMMGEFTEAKLEMSKLGGLNSLAVSTFNKTKWK